MSDLEGKSFIVTGANTGIGKATALALAKRGGRVVLAARSEEKTKPALEEIRAAVAGADVSFLALDLAKLSSVDRAAKTYLDSGKPLDVLVNNAGLAGQTGTTADGLEITTGTNHVGPFLFTERLLPLLREAEQGRIVNVSSKSHYQAKKLDLDALERPASHKGQVLAYYAQSKLMNVLHAKELARRLEGTNVTTYALHPGVVASDVWRSVPWPFRNLMKLFMISVEEGALTQLRCATAKELARETGRYYDAEREVKPSRASLDEGSWTALHDRTQELVAAILAR